MMLIQLVHDGGRQMYIFSYLKDDEKSRGLMETMVKVKINMDAVPSD